MTPHLLAGPAASWHVSLYYGRFFQSTPAHHTLMKIRGQRVGGDREARPGVEGSVEEIRRGARHRPEYTRPVVIALCAPNFRAS